MVEFKPQDEETRSSALVIAAIAAVVILLFAIDRGYSFKRAREADDRRVATKIRLRKMVRMIAQPTIEAQARERAKQPEESQPHPDEVRRQEEQLRREIEHWIKSF